jgi:AraC-like DNA-binding protein
MDADTRPTSGTPAEQAGAAFKAIKRIRAKRITEEVTAALLARKAGMIRARLSFLENGHLQASEDEIRRLDAALEKLISAKHQVQRFAAEVGWPA